MRRIFCLLAMLGLLGATAFSAAARGLPELLSALAESDPKPAIEALAANDDPKAKAALKALAEGLLFKRLADGAIVIGEKDGAMYVVTNAASGEIEDMAEPDKLEAVALPDDAKALLQAKAGVDTKKEDKPLDFVGAVKALAGESFAEKGRAIPG